LFLAAAAAAKQQQQQQTTDYVFLCVLHHHTHQALQRELGSVENIVRLAMEAGPVTTFSAPKLNSRLQKQEEEEDNNDDDNDLQNQLREEEDMQNRRPKALNLLLPQENEDTPHVALKEQEQKGMRFEALIRESSVVEEEPAANVPPNPPTYTMSSPAAKVSVQHFLPRFLLSSHLHKMPAQCFLPSIAIGFSRQLNLTHSSIIS
jgi:hypothetical protein